MDPKGVSRGRSDVAERTWRAHTIQRVADHLLGESDPAAALSGVADLLLLELEGRAGEGVRVRIADHVAGAGHQPRPDDHDVLVAPVLVGEDVVGDVTMLHDAAHAPDGDVRPLLAGVAAQLGTWWALARAHSDHRRDLDRITHLVETAPVGLALVDATGLVSFANATALQLVDADDVDEFPWTFELDPVTTNDPALATIAHVRRTGEPVHDVRVAVIGDDGTERVLAVNATPLAPGPGGDRGLALSISDVTSERRRALLLESALDREQRSAHELRRVGELKDAFLRALSHELRTPLAAIVGFVETLRDHGELLEEGQVDRMLDRLQANAQRLGLMLEDLLDVGRLTAGMRSTTNRADVDLAVLCRTIVELLPQDDHDIELSLAATPARVDRAKVERVIHNLVGNAIRHTPAGTRIRVRTHQDDDAVVLVVEDDGPGIPDEQRLVVFEPFVQGPRAASAASPGTGVGLALVRQFVELHDGTVSVDASPGGGARFTVTLPTAPDDEARH